MRIRTLAILALLAVVIGGFLIALRMRSERVGDTIAVYYCKPDGETVVPWRVSLGPARDIPSVAFYAATQAVAGPPSGVEAIRFPAGTIVRRVGVSTGTADVDLSNVGSGGGGSFSESGEFKALVWTLTALPTIRAVQVRIEGRKVPTLPGGHLELDEPLTRSSW